MYSFLRGFILTCLVVFVHSRDFYDGLENSRVQVATYLTTPVTKIIVSLEVTNTGKQNAQDYIIAIPQNLVQNLSAIEVSRCSIFIRYIQNDVS